ncbi:MAG: aspartate kinase [Firmicutes bacterium]|nr:aspartate kinase [Bacillota bacterium]
MLKVSKFGGSSLANSAQFRKVRSIAEADPDRRYIVVSACGKENDQDHKVTDLLYLCEAHIRYGVPCDDIFKLIENKYLKLKDDLGLTLDLESEFSNIRSAMDEGATTDYVVSRGEYLAARCMAEYLGAKFLDAADVIHFNFDGTFDQEKITRELTARTGGAERVVIPGFYGTMPDGAIRVMPRGGSDITGALIANAADADVYENWTDVSGFLVADPKIVDNPLSIPRINYSELRLMSYMGADVLHDDAIFPVKEKNIPINIRNTNDPEAPGTLILNDCSEQDRDDPPHLVTGISGRRHFSAFTLTKSHASTEVGFLRRLLAIFEDYKVSIEGVSVTVDTFTIIVRSDAVANCQYEILGRFSEEFKPEELKVEDHLSLIAVVGRGMKAVPGSSGQFLSEFGRNHINIRVISQCADELSVVVGVDDKDFERAINCIYGKFI